MEVFIERSNEIKNIEAKTVLEAMKKLKVNPTTVIVTRNNELITEDTKLNKNDKIKFLSVISGG